MESGHGQWAHRYHLPGGWFTHNSKGNYFDMETRLPNDARGRTHGEKTLDTIQHILLDQGLLRKDGNLAEVLTAPEPGFDDADGASTPTVVAKGDSAAADFSI